MCVNEHGVCVYSITMCCELQHLLRYELPVTIRKTELLQKVYVYDEVPEITSVHKTTVYLLSGSVN